jgi:Golgi phosphoprotein 3 (GPP34)
LSFVDRERGLPSVQNWEDTPFSLADDFYLIGLDGRSNRPRLHAKAMGLGVAAALLAELVLNNYIQIHQNRILVASRHYAPEAREHADMLSAIIAEPQHELPVWLSFFAQTSVDIVQERLVARRFMHVESRGMLRSKQTYVPVDPMSVEWRSLRIARLISKRDIRSWEDLSIIGLIVATGLTDVVMWNASAEDRENLLIILRYLNDEPSLHALITQVETLIAAAVLSQRK